MANPIQLPLLLIHSTTDEELVLTIRASALPFFLSLMDYLQSGVSLQEAFEANLFILSSLVKTRFQNQKTLFNCPLTIATKSRYVERKRTS